MTNQEQDREKFERCMAFIAWLQARDMGFIRRNPEIVRKYALAVTQGPEGQPPMNESG